MTDASQVLISGAGTKMSPLNRAASLVVDSRGAADIAECKVWPKQKKTSKPFSAATLDPFMFAFIDFFPLPIVLLVSLMDYSPFCFIVFFLVYIYSLVY